MGVFTVAGRNEMLDASSIAYAGLFDDDPEGAGVPVGGARQAVDLSGGAANGTISITAQKTFDITAGETVAYVGYYDLATGGTLLAKDDLTNTGAYSADGQYILESSTFTLS